MTFFYKTDIVRIDRNMIVANNFFSHFKKDEAMVRTVAYYLCYSFQNDRDYEDIDPYKMAKVMGLSVSTLQKNILTLIKEIL